MNKSPLSNLFTRCARGESAAWETLVAEFGPWIGSVVRRAAAVERATNPGDDDVDELMQELWCRLLAAEGRLLTAFRGESRSEAAAYLAAVARSVVVDRLRFRRAQKRRAVLLGLGGYDLADLTPGPEARLLRRERRETARRRLHDLLGPRTSRRNRHAVELALLGGLTSREIAARSRGRTSAGAVDSLVHRVRRRMTALGLQPPER